MALPTTSPRVRRKSLGLSERNLNNFDDNHTLPITSHELTKGKARISIDSQNHTITSSYDILSQEQRRRRAAQPRKSILKLNEGEIDFEPVTKVSESTSSRTPRASMPVVSSRKSIGFSRRVSFAPSAHVRMFEKDSEKKARRKSSMGGAMASSRPRPSLPAMPSRRSSIQGPSRVAPPSSPRPQYYVAEGEEEGEASMEMSEEDSDGSADSDEILSQLASPRASSSAGPTVDDDYISDESEEMDMEETTVMNEQIAQPWVEADTEDEQDGTEEDMSLENSTITSQSTDEEKTMDFTVALGGPMPSVPPQSARPNRMSIGYSNPMAEGQTENVFLPGDDSEMSMDMEETAAYGGVYGDESISSADDTTGTADPSGRTATYNFTATQATGMEFTTVVGGVVNEQDETGMDFTVAVGGINTVAMTENTGMEFTTVVGGFHQTTTSYTTQTNIFDTGRTNIFDTSRANIFDQQAQDHVTETMGGNYPVLEPGRIAPLPESPPPSTIRLRGSSATPGRPSRTTPNRPRASAIDPSGTPSFARPTAASASKSKDRQEKPTTTKKKNPFSTSPETPGSRGSRSSSRTPRKSDAGREMAASVAKRLSFSASSADTKPSTHTANVFAPTLHSASSATPSTSRVESAVGHASTSSSSTTPGKRPREEDVDDDAEPSAKRRNVFAGDEQRSQNVFSASEELPEEDVPEDDMEMEMEDEDREGEAEDYEQQDEDEFEDEGPELFIRAPDPLPPTPTRVRSSLGGPRRSLGAPVRIVNPPPMRSPSPAEEEPEEIQPIRLSEFLEMTNVEFMDHLPVVARRSSVGRGILGSEDREFALHDFVAANVESVYVHFFQWAIDKMVTDIKDLQEELSSTEKVLDENNPIVVREYLSATDEDRSLFQMMLREYKANTVLRARSYWYDWKRSIMEKISPDVQSIRDEMAADAERYRSQLEITSKLVPDLRARHEALKAELAQHRAAVAEIEQCDQEELKELKAGVVEQNAEIERFTAELDDKKTKIDELEQKSAQLEAECEAHRAATEQARAESSESSPSDVLRLETEHRALQDLHGWRIIRASPLQLTYNDELDLTVPITNGVEDLNNASLGLIKATSDGATAALLNLTRRALNHTRPATLAALVRTTGQLWTSARHMRDELNILKLYYPSTYSGDDVGFVATAAVMLPKTRARVSLSFSVGPGTLLAWPSTHAVAAVKIRAETVYGTADTVTMQNTAQDTLADVVADVPGVFLQACASAADVHA